jgi:hypothetical protein
VETELIQSGSMGRSPFLPEAVTFTGLRLMPKSALCETVSYVDNPKRLGRSAIAKRCKVEIEVGASLKVQWSG